MADLRNDILKEEEQIGGYQPGEPDDDSFIVQDKSYPGNIFLFLNPIKKEELANDLENDNINDFSDEPFANENKSDDSDENPYSLNDPLSGEEEEEELFEYEKKKLNKTTDSEDNLDDPDLIGYIKGLVSVSNRKSKKKQNEQSESSDENLNPKPFDPVTGNNAETKLIISDFDLDKPSTSTITERLIPESEKSIPTPKINSNKESEKNETDKKKKKLPIWIWLPAAAILIGGIGIGSYYNLFNKNNNKGHNLTTKLDSNSIKNNGFAENQKSDRSDSRSDSTIDNKKDEQKNDSVKSNKLINNENQIPDISKNAEMKIQNTETNQIPVVPQKLATKESEKNKYNPESDISKSQNLKEEIKIIENKVTAKDSKKQEPKLIVEPKPIVEKKVTEKKSNVAVGRKNSKKDDVFSEVRPKEINIQEVRDKAVDETFIPKDEPGIYIVQIYSSISKEDATMWLNKLKARNITDAFITEQTVRDKVWYRVRFGKFTTREEARNAAMRYGFAQTWIDRVK